MGAKEVFVSDYWKERQAQAQATLTQKGIEATEKQLQRYYKTTMLNVIDSFEKVYMKLQLNIAEGITPTPADLYRLDSYWTMQAQLREELQRLGDKQAVQMARDFTNQYRTAYRALALQDGGSFSQISKETAQQMINQIWAADGQSWSSRIWKNTSKLQEELNEKLIDCVLTGKSTEVLKRDLMERFSVSYSRADSIVRTEYNHIQTQAAQQRYKDMGVEMVQVWADYDERRCDACGKLHEKKYSVHDRMPIPAHPRCRCTIIPVIDTQVHGEQLKLEGF